MQRRIRQILSKRYPALLWTIFIFILMTIPGNMLPREDTTFIPNLDKLVHAILFGTFVFLWSYYYTLKKNTILISRYTALLIIASLYGIATEFIQKYLIPNRDFSIYDITADIAGAVIGYIIVRITFSRFKIPADTSS
jgi:VanZ family protein